MHPRHTMTIIIIAIIINIHLQATKQQFTRLTEPCAVPFSYVHVSPVSSRANNDQLHLTCVSALTCLNDDVCDVIAVFALNVC